MLQMLTGRDADLAREPSSRSVIHGGSAAAIRMATPVGRVCKLAAAIDAYVLSSCPSSSGAVDDGPLTKSLRVHIRRARRPWLEVHARGGRPARPQRPGHSRPERGAPLSLSSPRSRRRSRHRVISKTRRPATARAPAASCLCAPGAPAQLALELLDLAPQPRGLVREGRLRGHGRAATSDSSTDRCTRGSRASAAPRLITASASTISLSPHPPCCRGGRSPASVHSSRSRSRRRQRKRRSGR